MALAVVGLVISIIARQNYVKQQMQLVGQECITMAIINVWLAVQTAQNALPTLVSAPHANQALQWTLSIQKSVALAQFTLDQ